MPAPVPRQELIEVLGPALDGELEHLVPILVKKAGVVSVAGRDNFLAVRLCWEGSRRGRVWAEGAHTRAPCRVEAWWL